MVEFQLLLLLLMKHIVYENVEFKLLSKMDAIENNLFHSGVRIFVPHSVVLWKSVPSYFHILHVWLALQQQHNQFVMRLSRVWK